MEKDTMSGLVKQKYGVNELFKIKSLRKAAKKAEVNVIVGIRVVDDRQLIQNLRFNQEQKEKEAEQVEPETELCNKLVEDAGTANTEIVKEPVKNKRKVEKITEYEYVENPVKFGPKADQDDEFDWKGAFERLDEEMSSMLQDYFERAFTILVYKFGLQPKHLFDFEIYEGVGQIPVFLNEATIQYVEEISKKIVVLSHQEVLDGAVFHVNVLDKDNFPVTKHRIIFRPYGAFEVEYLDVSNESKIQQTLSLARDKISEILKEISDFPIQELKYPMQSQWSISLGLVPDFVKFLKQNGHGTLGPFSEDPSADYFPWKKRPRLSQAVKLGLINPPLPKISSTDVAQNGLMSQTRSEEEQNAIVLNKPKEASSIAKMVVKLPEWKYYSSDSEDEKNPPKAIKEFKQTLFLNPVSSIEIFPRFMLVIYGIKYPNEENDRRVFKVASRTESSDTSTSSKVI